MELKSHKRVFKKSLIYGGIGGKEMVKITAIVVFLSITVWYTSKIHVLTANGDDSNARVTRENYSAVGIVSDISSTPESTISISNGTISDGDTNQELTFNSNTINKVESTDYTILSLADINLGDKIIAQGLKSGNVIKITRIIDLSWTAASTTDDIIASSTDSSSTSTSTDSIISTTTSTSTISDIATSTITTPDPDDMATSTIASSTLATTTEDTTGSTTDLVASTTNQ